ncbi:MAG: hypothetical protein CMM28_05280 [Rhodospirillaceae bacterium]|nr:hypothetical protein [Rhodospirillaceae bacterium]
MFRRREKPSLSRRVTSVLWPSIGWRRWLIYLKHRLGRLPGTPYSIAAGFACGAAISFTPFVGFHFFLGGIWAWILRANILASAIGTAVGNPWTFPFIWIWLYTLGHWMGAGNADTAAQSLEFEVFFTGMFNGVLMMDMGYLVEHVWPVLWPMLVGAIPTMLFVWFLFYLPLNSLIHTYQLRRLRRMRRNEYKGES